MRSPDSRSAGASRTASGYVDLLAVDPSERGRGLGVSLLLTAFEDFARAGLREAWLDVASDNPRGLRLYHRAGMTERVRIDVYEKPVHFGGTGRTAPGVWPAPRRLLRRLRLSRRRRPTGATGLEPATSAVTGQRSNQLSYAPWWGSPSMATEIASRVSQLLGRRGV